jgi:hypothetical protein
MPNNNGLYSAMSGRYITPPEIPLSLEHSNLARQIWDLLHLATTPLAAQEAREAFISAPVEVRSAILAVYAEFWRQGTNPQSAKNPFEPDPLETN